MARVLLLNRKDNVATFLEDGQQGETLEIKIDEQRKNIEVKENISMGHKIAITDIKKGDNIIKYGEVIGRATDDILEGYHAHVHNIESLRVRFDLVEEE